MKVSFQGHHGTRLSSALNIKKNNFEPSFGDEEWLGNGVYFFVDGINKNTTELAEKWAIAQAWDNSEKCYLYKDYAVLMSTITVDENELLDLTTAEGVEVFQYLVEKFEDKLKTIGRKLGYLDGFLINLAREEKIFPISVVKGNFFIKFTKERIYRMNFRTTNCTICSVVEPINNLSNTNIVKTNKIL